MIEIIIELAPTLVLLFAGIAEVIVGVILFRFYSEKEKLYSTQIDTLKTQIETLKTQNESLIRIFEAEKALLISQKKDTETKYTAVFNSQEEKDKTIKSLESIIKNQKEDLERMKKVALYEKFDVSGTTTASGAMIETSNPALKAIRESKLSWEDILLGIKHM